MSLDPEIKLDSELKVAFGVRLTCQAVQQTLGSLAFPDGQLILVSEEEHNGADESGNPNATILK